MLSCPNCATRLTRAVTRKGIMHLCGKCGGRSVATAVLRKQASPAFLKKLRLAAYGRVGKTGRRCPHCDQPMRLAILSRAGEPLELDLCPRCHVVWFDPREFAQVAPAEPPEPEMPAAAEGVHVEAVATGAEAAAESGGPDSAWKYLPGILGWPVEMRAIPVGRKPVLTWMLSALMVIVTAALLAEGSLREAIAEYGFVPSQWGRHGGMTILYSFFLHAGLFHLISNAYFLLVFGDNAEDHLGGWRFVLLVGSAHVGGVLMHAWLDPRGGVPLVGASAGISGVLAYYALVFPHARLGFFFWLFWRWLRIRAFWAFVLYLGVQLFGAWRQIGGFTGVSFLGHLGGLAVGVIVALVARYGRVTQTAPPNKRLSSQRRRGGRSR